MATRCCAAQREGPGPLRDGPFAQEAVEEELGHDKPWRMRSSWHGFIDDGGW